MSGYDFHPEALADLDEIWDFIAEDNVNAAERVVRDILAGVRKLTASPYQGHSRIDLASPPLRFWRVRDYLIAYAPDEKPLWVIAVVHGRRNPRAIASILSGREA